MQRSSRPFGWSVPICVLAALLLLPGSSFAQPSRSTTPNPPLVGFSDAGLPAALRVPLAERMGFAPAALSEVLDPHVTGGMLEITVRLLPATNSLFLPRASSAPPLDLAELRAMYAPPPSVYEGWTSYLHTFGLSVGPLTSDGMQFSAHGTASGVGHAFATTVYTGLYGNRLVQFPSPAPTLPPGLSSSVAAVLGLSSGWSEFTLPFATQQATRNLITPNEAHDAYQLSALYNFSGTSHWASSVSIAVVLWGEGYDESDISTFFSQYYPGGWPLPSVQPYPVDGAPSPSPGAVNDPSQAPVELTLDIEWAGATAPGATIDAVYAPDGPSANNYSPTDVALDHALTQAVGISGVEVVSMSFATSDQADPSLQAAFESTFASATSQGITFVAASGDNGGAAKANGACTTTAQPEYPAASPLVLSVGGTAPVLDVSLGGTVTGINNEPAWNGSGGGTSLVYAAPSWQHGVSSAASGHRGIPDVAGPAALNFLYFGGTTRQGDGTSFAAPFWAGIIGEMDAIRGTPFGFLDPRIYSIAAAEPNGTVADSLVDITAGANCLNSAVPGWDTVTGWGTPRAVLLYENLVGSYVHMNLSVSPGTVSPGQSLTASVRVTNASSNASLPNLLVQFSSTSTAGYAGPCGGTFSSANGTTNTTGWVSVSLVVSNCYLGSHAAITASLLQGGYFGSNSTAVTVNLIGLAAFLTFIEQFPYNLLTFALLILAAVLIGRSFSNRSRRKTAARRIANPGPPRPAAPPIVGARAASPPTAVAPVAPAVGATTTSARRAAPARPPAPVVSPSCAVCGFALDPALTFCPRCGSYRPTGTAKGPPPAP
ncbi:MAG: S53 family peptidase [Thermoplasmata archaeon]|nr:S53 family peptidase [Thermoplasmata archaeon]